MAKRCQTLQSYWSPLPALQLIATNHFSPLVFLLPGPSASTSVSQPFFSVSCLFWKSQDLLSPSWGKRQGLLPLPTQFTPSVCWEMHQKMEVESGPSHIYGREIRGVLSYWAFFSFLFFLPLLLQQLRECCRGCLTPFPFSHAKLLPRKERRSLTWAPACLGPPPLMAKLLRVVFFLKATLQLPQGEGFPQPSLTASPRKATAVGPAPQSACFTHRRLPAALFCLYFHLRRWQPAWFVQRLQEYPAFPLPRVLGYTCRECLMNGAGESGERKPL